MVDSEHCREKLSQYRIEGQSKPFVDKDLQLQLPGQDSCDDKTDHVFNRIYSHYLNSYPSISDIHPEFNEAELYRAMQKATHSYEAWTQMKEQIQNTIQSKN